MLFNIMNNYCHIDDFLDEALEGFKYRKTDYDKATIEINSIEELNNLAKVLGKILVREGSIVYYVD